MDYQELPKSGIVQPGFYDSQYGRVWVTEREPEYVYDYVDEFGTVHGHNEPRYSTEMAGVDGPFLSLVDVSLIIAAFEERNKKWRMEDSFKY